MEERFATEYIVALAGRNIKISRYQKHNRVIPDGKWIAVYANSFDWEHFVCVVDGTYDFVYKNYTPFDTADDALKAARIAIANEIKQRKALREKTKV